MNKNRNCKHPKEIHLSSQYYDNGYGYYFYYDVDICKNENCGRVKLNDWTKYQVERKRRSLMNQAIKFVQNQSLCSHLDKDIIYEQVLAVYDPDCDVGHFKSCVQTVLKDYDFSDLMYLDALESLFSYYEDQPVSDLQEQAIIA